MIGEFTLNGASDWHGKYGDTLTFIIHVITWRQAYVV